MNRAAKGSSHARNVHVQLRVSKDEADALTLIGGSTALGVRALIDTHLTFITRPVLVKNTLDEPEYDPLADLADKPHRHRRGDKIRDEWDAGMKIPVYACACGQEMR